MGGFFHTEIFSGAEIITPVEVIDPICILTGDGHCAVCGTSVCQDDFQSVGRKPLAALFDMLFLISGNDACRYWKQAQSS